MVIAEDGTRVGNMLVNQAMQIATDTGKDLVEISPNTDPPVCKIIEYGKFVYEQKKNQKQPKTPDVKEFRFGINIFDHDLQVKARQITELLDKNHPIKIVIRFRGREITRKEAGNELLDKLKLLIANGHFSEVKEEDKTFIITIRKK